MIPSIFAYAITQCHTRFLQTQNNVVPMMVCTGLTTVLHFFICWILVFKSGLGNKGAALANAISYWINALSLVLYVRISPSCKSTWTGFSSEAFRGIPKFLTLSIPSAVMLTYYSLTHSVLLCLFFFVFLPLNPICIVLTSWTTSCPSSLEIWSFEMMVLLSGLLPNPKLETSVLSIRFGFYSKIVLHMDC